jgi:vacuolar-type H+-ATPase subunit I/STV1
MFIPALVRGAASVSTGVISKAGKTISPKSILRVKRKAKVATGRIGKSFKDGLNNSSYEHNQTKTQENNTPKSSPSIMNTVPMKLGAAISNSKSSITNIMNNISEMSGNSQLKLLLVEIRKVRELVAQNGIDIKDVDLVARQINQSSSQLKTQLEIFKDSFDSDKTNKDNELRDIQDNIAKLQKSLKELSDLADSGGLGGGGISDLLSGGYRKCRICINQWW